MAKGSSVTDEKAPLSSASVLIIDDEPSVALLLLKQLRRLGASNIVTANDGYSALAKLDEDKYDIIFCDLCMPGCDGVETMRMMAERGIDSSIILLSGADPRLLRAARELGSSRGLSLLGSLTKPFAMSDLRSLVESVPVRQQRRAGGSARKLESPSQLATAISQGQLELHYQPQVDLNTYELTGVEALVRWNHPTKGMLFPDVFIPVAESTDLIEPLTDWVVDAAISQSKEWLDDGLELDISVNLSAKTLRRLDLPDRLMKAVSTAGILPQRLTLEVTETGVTDDVEALLDITTRLRLKGFPLSIDDFGTGFANLTQLQRLPFTELKLDRSFVNAASGDDDAALVLRSSVELARLLHLQTVAEGIETEAEWDLVKSLKVDRGQGYFMARPMPAAKLRDWLDDWQAKASHNRQLKSVG